MKEKNKNIFYDVKSLERTMDIEKRCNKGYLQKKLSKAFPNEKLTVVEAYINTSGKFINKSKGLLGSLLPINRVHNLPEFCHVVVEHSTGKFTEKIFIWSPVKWNDRFLGCVGGGTATGGCFSHGEFQLFFYPKQS